MLLGIEDPAIRGMGTRGRTSNIPLLTGFRATPFMALAAFAETMVSHDMASRTKGNPFFGERDRVQSRAASFISGIEINEGSDIVTMQQVVNAEGIMSSIEETFGKGKLRIELLEIKERVDKSQAVVAGGLKEIEVNRQIIRTVRSGEGVQGAAEVILFAIAVPAPVSIRIREFAGTITAEDAVFPAIAEQLAVRASARANSGTIPGDR